LFFVLFFPLTGAVCGTKQVRSWLMISVFHTYKE
jgi:hypothetical protein